MAYTKHTWTNGSGEAINATNLNEMETGIDEAHDASNITNTPAGNIAATNVQSALDELDTEKVAKAGDTMAGDLNQGGNYLVNSASMNALNAKGTGYWFDGVDDYIYCGADASLNNLSEFSIEVFGITRNIAKEQSFMNAGMTTGDGTTPGYRLNLKNSKVQFALEPDGAHYTEFNANTTLKSDVYYHIIGTYKDKVNGTKIYLNGVNDGQMTIADITTNTRAKYISHTWYLEGGIKMSRIWNRTLTSTEVKILSSGVPVEFADIGANATLIVPSDDCADDDTANWTDVNGALTFDTDHYVYTVTTGASVATFTDEAALTIGKRYRATILVKDGTGTGSTVRINSLTNAGVAIENGTSITVDGTYTTASVEWVATETNNKVQVEIIAGSVSDAETILFDDIETNHIGCVLQLEQDGIGHDMWLDNSGNENHGTVSGALPINLPVNHQEKYIDLAVTGDTSFTLPQGYLISSIVLTSDGAIGGGMDIGTSDGGGEIVTAQAIAGAGTVLCTLVAGANYNTTGADDTIYITDADGTGWDSASVIVRVQMQRIEL